MWKQSRLLKWQLNNRTIAQVERQNRLKFQGFACCRLRYLNCRINNLTMEELKAMQEVDIRTVDSATLRDIRDVHINTDLPKPERMLDFRNL